MRVCVCCFLSTALISELFVLAVCLYVCFSCTFLHLNLLSVQNYLVIDFTPVSRFSGLYMCAFLGC